MKYLTFQTHLCSLLACRRQVLSLCLLEHLTKEQGKADRGGDGGEKGGEGLLWSLHLVQVKKKVEIIKVAVGC